MNNFLFRWAVEGRGARRPK